MKRAFVAAIAILALTITKSAQAQTFSLAGNWTSSSDSASNIWSYGIYTSSVFSVPSSTTNTTSSGINYWNLSAGTDPNMEINTTGSAVFSGSNVEFQPGEVSFGPYNGPTAAQFIVPTTGTYVIDATFQTDQKRTSGSNPVTSDGTTGYVYVNGTSVYSQALTDPGGAQLGLAQSYNGTPMLLVAGEKVLFVVGGGAFTTQVDATLQDVPEPPVFVLMLGGILLALGIPRVRTFVSLRA